MVVCRPSGNKTRAGKSRSNESQTFSFAASNSSRRIRPPWFLNLATVRQ